MITFVTQIRETIHVAELRKRGDDVITSFLETFGHVHNKENNHKSTKQTNVLFKRCRSYKNI